VAQIAASIKEFGWTNPVLVDGDNGIIAGHGRVLAARKLEATEIPVIELQGLSEAQRRAYILADNRLAQNAGWDEDLLHLELTELGNADFDLSLLGFEPGELKDLLADEPEEGLTDPDEVPEPPAEA
jgi:ParB-like chromosome segregation protein Spo0J